MASYSKMISTQRSRVSPSTLDFCATLFDPGQATCFANTAYGADIYYVSQAANLVKPPAFFSINAIKPGSRRNDNNVVALRSFLIECDDGPLKVQSTYIKALQVPWATLTFSGSKSLHYIIALDTPLESKAIYDAYARRIHKVVEKCDHTTKNPSRLSRFPGHFREEKGYLQKLIEVRQRIPLSQLEMWLVDHGVPYEEPRVSFATPALLEVADGVFMLSEPNHFTDRFIAFGSERGQRNKDLYLAAHDLRECGYSMEVAISMLEKSPVVNEFDFSRKEFERTILSAFQKNTL